MNQPSSRAMALVAGLLLSTSAAAQPTEPDAADESLAPIEAPALDDPLPRAFATKRGGLTADEVGRLAQASSPEVRASQAEIEAAAAKVDAAMISFFPRVTLSANYTRLSPVGSSLGSGALVGAAESRTLGHWPLPDGQRSVRCRLCREAGGGRTLRDQDRAQQLLAQSTRSRCRSPTTC